MTGARRVAVVLGGALFTEWVSVEISRDMQDLAGKFQIEVRDAVRSIASLPFGSISDFGRLVALGMTAEIAIDGEVVLQGWVDTVAPHIRDGQASVSISGSDKARDLIDGAATLDGPSEHRGKTVDTIIGEIIKPYGLTVRAEVDVGDAVDCFVVDLGETALSAIEKGLRQRGILATSDGMGAIVLTRTGAHRAPAALKLPGNVIAAGGEWTVEGRHSEYRVKGGGEKAGGKRGKAVKLDATAHPLITDTPADATAQGEKERSGVTIEGKARDPEMRRYRPSVTVGRTQLTADGAQQQAEWMERTARGASERIEYEVKDFRAGDDDRLWRINELVPVDDAYQGINRDMLIAGVAYRDSEQDGERTVLRVTSPDAYDTEPVGKRRTNHKRGRTGPLDSTAHAP